VHGKREGPSRYPRLSEKVGEGGRGENAGLADLAYWFQNWAWRSEGGRCKKKGSERKSPRGQGRRFSGRWHIVSNEGAGWGREYLNEEVRAFIESGENDKEGLVPVRLPSGGIMDLPGGPGGDGPDLRAEFSWERLAMGADRGTPLMGSGWRS